MSLPYNCIQKLSLLSRSQSQLSCHTMYANYHRAVSVAPSHWLTPAARDVTRPAAASHWLTPSTNDAMQVRHAGHAKWQNIKHTKDANDHKRAILFGKISKQIIFAVRAGGPNPKSNAALDTVFKIAAKNGMPNKTRDGTVEKAMKTTTNGKTHWLSYRGPNGICMLVKLFTDKPQRARLAFSFFKKKGFKEERAGLKGMFTEVGQITCGAEVGGRRVGAAEAEEHAIEGNAEEVLEEEGQLVFKTAGEDVYSCSSYLTSVGYSVEDLVVLQVPRVPITVDDETKEEMAAMVERMEEVDDFTEAFFNFQ